MIALNFKIFCNEHIINTFMSQKSDQIHQAHETTKQIVNNYLKCVDKIAEMTSQYSDKKRIEEQMGRFKQAIQRAPNDTMKAKVFTTYLHDTLSNIFDQLDIKQKVSAKRATELSKNNEVLQQKIWRMEVDYQKLESQIQQKTHVEQKCKNLEQEITAIKKGLFKIQQAERLQTQLKETIRMFQQRQASMENNFQLQLQKQLQETQNKINNKVYKQLVSKDTQVRRLKAKMQTLLEQKGRLSQSIINKDEDLRYIKTHLSERNNQLSKKIEQQNIKNQSLQSQIGFHMTTISSLRQSLQRVSSHKDWNDERNSMQSVFDGSRQLQKNLSLKIQEGESIQVQRQSLAQISKIKKGSSLQNESTQSIKEQSSNEATLNRQKEDQLQSLKAEIVSLKATLVKSQRNEQSLRKAFKQLQSRKYSSDSGLLEGYQNMAQSLKQQNQLLQEQLTALKAKIKRYQTAKGVKS